MELGGFDYLAVFAASLALSLGLTPLALRFAVRRRILDHPNEIKAQTSPVPYLGGVAIVLSFAIVVIGAAILVPPPSQREEIFLIIGLASALSILGLVDDLKGLSPLLRLGVEVLAAVAVWTWSTGVTLFQNDPLDLVITVVWIVGVTNAVNFLDNMDGLSAGVASIAAAFIFILAASNGQFLVATLAAGIAGCAAGFLRSNFHPARIYMGDAGALFLGFLLAVLAIRLRFDGPAVVTFFVPILVLGVALFDTGLIMVNRVLNGRNPMMGGRDHTSHRLVFVGVSVPLAVALIYAAAVSLGILAVVMSHTDEVSGFVLMGWVLVSALAAAILLSRVPVYETSTRRRYMIQEVARHEVEPLAAPGLHSVSDGSSETSRPA